MVALAEAPFNPLDKRHLGESVARALLQRSVGPLPPAPAFPGAGVYAIYYTGDYEPYRPIVERNRNDQYQQPIYVGKAVPKGAMKGGFGLDAAVGNVLVARLREHARSIEQAENIGLNDFQCRYLVAEDIWIPLGEALLIEWFQPLWNILVTGFGNHPTGRRRERQNRSFWDTFHPGRPWAARLSPNLRTRDELEQMIRDLLAGREVPILSPQQAVMEEAEEQQEDEE